MCFAEAQDACHLEVGRIDRHLDTMVVPPVKQAILTNLAIPEIYVKGYLKYLADLPSVGSTSDRSALEVGRLHAFSPHCI